MNLRTLLFAISLLFSWSTLHAQQDPFIGSWKLNLSKSNADGTQDDKRVDKFDAYGKNGLRYTSVTVDDKGKQQTISWAAEPDGKQYPMTGSPRWDSTSLKRVDAHHIEMLQKKAGRPDGKVQRAISPDGMTMTYHGGAGMLVFDKQ